MNELRPRSRADCEPRPCPWCGQRTGMRLESVSVEDGSLVVCIECRQRVVYYSHGHSGTWHWACASPTTKSPPLDEAHLRALNACRPCPWVSCSKHLYLEVNPNTGAMKINFKGQDPDQLENSCSLDVADRGGMTLKEVGDTIRLTRERIRQLEVGGTRKLRLEKIYVEARDFVPDDDTG